MWIVPTRLGVLSYALTEPSNSFSLNLLVTELISSSGGCDVFKDASSSLSRVQSTHCWLRMCLSGTEEEYLLKKAFQISFNQSVSFKVATSRGCYNERLALLLMAKSIAVVQPRWYPVLTHGLSASSALSSEHKTLFATYVVLQHQEQEQLFRNELRETFGTAETERGCAEQLRNTKINCGSGSIFHLLLLQLICQLLRAVIWAFCLFR